MATTGALYPDLDGVPVFVTGGADGIGRAIVEAFLAQGSRVGVLDIDNAAIARLLGEAPGLAAEQVDLRDIQATRFALARLIEKVGEPRILINNAANDTRHAFEDLTVEAWDDGMAINLRHMMFVSQAVAPAMRRAGGGVILNMGSTAWMKGATRLIAYTTAKSAIDGFTRSLSRELGAQGIRVNAIAPGWVMTARQLSHHATPEKRAANLEAQAIKLEIMPRDISAAALFLCSSSARAITGQTLIVDGGSCYG
ncbi:FabG Dehydrogenases with different specificities (related to short-chain alcohol dehydrogenases) [Rhabdaerophilaceae bacterium]